MKREVTLLRKSWGEGEFLQFALFANFRHFIKVWPFLATMHTTRNKLGIIVFNT